MLLDGLRQFPGFKPGTFRRRMAVGDYFPSRMYIMDPEEVHRFEKMPPFDDDLLTERDEFGSLLDVVARGPSRVLLRHNSSGCLFDAKIEAYTVTSWRVLTGHEALDTYIRVGWQLPDAFIQKMKTTLRLGAVATTAFKALFGENVARYIDLFDQSPHGNGLRYHFRIRHRQPFRSAAIRIDVNSSGQIVDWELLQGRKGYDAMQNTYYRTGKWKRP